MNFNDHHLQQFTFKVIPSRYGGRFATVFSADTEKQPGQMRQVVPVS